MHPTEAKQRVVGRIDWIYQLDLVKTLHNRINRNQTHTLFWSKDQKKIHCLMSNFDIHLTKTKILSIMEKF